MVVACDAATPPQSPVLGSIRVTSVTTGQDLDTDGYQVTTDGFAPLALQPDGEVTFSLVPAGSREIRISGVATNCSVGGGLNQRVTVAAGQSATIALTITCVTRGPGLPAGTLDVTTSTTGAELDPNGYSALVLNVATGSSNSLFLPATGNIKVEVVPSALYFVVLSGVASNCHIAGPGLLTKNVAVASGQTVAVTFEIRCEPSYPMRLAAGSQLAFVRNGSIHLVNSDGTGVVKLTDGLADCDPAWSPDGARIAFVRNCSTTNASLYIMNADGSNLVRWVQGGWIADPAWSPDGTLIAYAQADGSMNLYLLDVVNVVKDPTVLIALPGWDAQPAWAPDGKTIAFASDYAMYDFVSDVYVISVAGSGIEKLTAAAAGSGSVKQFYEPAWSRDGSMIAVDKCWLEYYTCDSGILTLLNRQGNEIRELAAIRGWSSPTWGPDGLTIAFSWRDDINWVRASGDARGFIVENGHSPAWRPLGTATSRK